MSAPDDDPPKSPDTAPDAPPAEPPPTVEVAPYMEAYTETGAAPAPVEPAPPAGDEQAILPPTYDEDALRDAIGPTPMREKKRRKEPLDDDGLPRPAGRRTIAIATLAIIVGIAVAGLVFLGRANTQRYAVACTSTQVSAEQGRAFPPWGTRPLTGPEWRPVTLPPNAECKARETDTIAELESWYLDILLDRANSLLTARDFAEQLGAPGKANPLDAVTEQLNQALLLARSPERRDQRKEVERLQGDVQYWRASLRLRDASAALADAARQFDAAAAQRPRHVTDAAQWAGFLRKLADDLRGGPGGAASAIAPGPVAPPLDGDRPGVPLGTALPVEPEASPPDEPETPIDAGMPTGGVLL